MRQCRLFSSVSIGCLVVGFATAESRPDNTSICDYYTKLSFDDDNQARQYEFIATLVNLAMVGHTRDSNTTLSTPYSLRIAKDADPFDGILNPSQSKNTSATNLLPFFNGGLKTTNRGGAGGGGGVAINFLDDGALEPLMKGKPADGTRSGQFKMMTHLYSYTGILLGCSQMGDGKDDGEKSLPTYKGQNGQARVHKYMDLNREQIDHYISRFTLAAATLGFTKADISILSDRLTKPFGYKCSAPTNINSTQAPQLQSICLDKSCPEDPNDPRCDLYGKDPLPPVIANATLAMGLGSNMTYKSSTLNSSLSSDPSTSNSSDPLSGSNSSTLTSNAASPKNSKPAAGLALSMGRPGWETFIPTIGLVVMVAQFA